MNIFLILKESKCWISNEKECEAKLSLGLTQQNRKENVNNMTVKINIHFFKN